MPSPDSTNSPLEFHYKDCLIRAYLDDGGELLWLADDVRKALCKYDGLHNSMDKYYFSSWDMLAIASDIHGHPKLGGRFAIWVKNCLFRCDLLTESFFYLFWCVMGYTISQDNEAYYYGIFKTTIDTLIPGARIVERKGKKGAGTPDFWIEIGDNVCPVEIKKGDFTSQAVRQLRGYIKKYDARCGYAVAHQLTANLDDNMIFVNFPKVEL